MPSYRIQKVSAQLMREISKLVNADFSENYGLITVSDIDLTADFKDAKVYLTIFNENKEEEILKRLGYNALEYQRDLGRKLKMKFTPHLIFKIDHGQDKIDHIDKLLKEIDHGS